MKRSKSYRQASEQIDRSKFYSPAEAVALAKAEKVTKFDPTVEVALRLGVDPRKQDQMVRGTVNLDRKSTRLNSSHSSISYAVFCLKKKKKTNNTDNHTQRTVLIVPAATK